MLAGSFGVPCAMIGAALLGLTLRFDYWSNTVEFLAGCLVVTHCLSWPLGLGLGLVLGLGRETIPFLALASGGWPIGLGAAAATSALRRFNDRDPQWDQADRDLEYGKRQWKRNWESLRNPPVWGDIAVYLLLACLAGFTAPLLTLALVGTTVTFARIDEPRVLTMLVPFASLTVARALGWQ